MYYIFGKYTYKVDTMYLIFYYCFVNTIMTHHFFHYPPSLPKSGNGGIWSLPPPKNPVGENASTY